MPAQTRATPTGVAHKTAFRRAQERVMSQKMTGMPAAIKAANVIAASNRGSVWCRIPAPDTTTSTPAAASMERLAIHRRGLRRLSKSAYRMPKRKRPAKTSMVDTVKTLYRVATRSGRGLFTW